MSALHLLRADPLTVYATEPPGLGGMSDPQKRFHQDQGSKRIFRAGNQIGKTRSGSAEAWWFATSCHPYREVPPAPNNGWILASDLKNGWPSICAKMREIEPVGILDPGCTYDRARGYYYRGLRCIRLNNGSLIVGKGSDQKIVALSSSTVDWAWVDEVPKESHWSELRTRLGVRQGSLWITLTPCGRPVDWLRDLIDGSPVTGSGPSEPGWSSHVVPLKWSNCPHRTEEDIAAQVASVPLYERSVRIAAGWEGITIARQVPGFSDSNIFTIDEDHPLDALTSIGIGVDYGEIVGNTLYCLVGFQESNGVLYCLGEWSPSSRMSTAEEVIGIRDNLIQPWGLTFYHIEHWRGDSNSAGRRGIAATVNQLIERGIADLLGSSSSIINCRPPFKGPGSVKARARLISSKAVEHKLMIHENCTRIIGSLRHWMGKNDSYKHAFDSLGYISDVYLGLEATIKNNPQPFTIIR